MHVLGLYPYNFGHLPILIALTAVGVGIQLAIEGAATAPLDAGARWALCGGVALYLLTITAIYLATSRALRDVTPGVSLAAAASALGLALAGAILPLFAVVGVLFITLAGLVTFKVVYLALADGGGAGRGLESAEAGEGGVRFGGGGGADAAGGASD